MIFVVLEYVVNGAYGIICVVTVVVAGAINNAAHGVVAVQIVRDFDECVFPIASVI